MEVITYLRIIGRYWWLILLATLVATAVAAAITFTKPHSYTAHARVVAQPSRVLSDTRTLVDMTGQVGYRPVMNTLAQVFTSESVRNDAYKAAGLDAKRALDYPLEANVLPDSSVIEVSARGRDPVLLAKYVNSTVDAAVKHGSDVYRVIDLMPLERAAVPEVPTSPLPARDIPIGAGLGIALGLLLAFATEYMRTPRRGDAEVPVRVDADVPVRVVPISPTTPLSSNRDDKTAVNGASSTPRHDHLETIQQSSALSADLQDDSSPG